MVAHITLIMAVISGMLVLFIGLSGLRKKRRTDTEILDLVKPKEEQASLNDHDEGIISVRTLKATPTEQARTIAPQTNPPNIIVINLFAEQNIPYAGFDILQTLLAKHLRFGEMNIFHRHVETRGTGPVLFSCVSATEPGTFDIQNIGAQTIKGLSFFMRLSTEHNDIDTFNLMLSTVQALMNELGGRLYDANKQLLTREIIQAMQNDILALTQETAEYA